MSQAPSSRTSTLPATAAQAVDRICDWFEAAWRAGQTPRIEDYLQSADGQARHVLLQQLLLLELDYRSRGNQTPGPAEYRARFPNGLADVEAAFAAWRAAWPRSEPDLTASVFGRHTGSLGSTSTGLVQRVRARDGRAWQRLVELYTPLVYRLCRQGGLAPEDAGDVAQEVFTSVVRSIHDFRDTGRPGSFRAWLAGITRHRIIDHVRRELRQPQAPGGTAAQAALREVPGTTGSVPSGAAPDDEGTVWRRALELIRSEFEERTWQSFWHVVVDGQTPADVAARLGMSVPAVHQAKSRVLRRLREEFRDA